MQLSFTSCPRSQRLRAGRCPSFCWRCSSCPSDSRCAGSINTSGNRARWSSAHSCGARSSRQPSPGSSTMASGAVITKVVGGDFSYYWSAALTAPVVEETYKYLGIVLLYLIARAEFDDLIDGFVYGALIGLGFAVPRTSTTSSSSSAATSAPSSRASMSASSPRACTAT